MNEEDQHAYTISSEELESLLQNMYEKYGYDFRSYSQAHLKRRIKERLILSRTRDIKKLQLDILSSPTVAASLLKDLSINVTEMYRDPATFKMIREEVIPILKTFPYIKIWHAGCSTGQEVYSMAILLCEEGLYDRSLIYATDFNQHVLDQAKEGVYTNDEIKKYTKNHQLSGPKQSLSDYYTSKYNRVIMSKSLKKNIVWANHNLATDEVFAEVQLVMCRNVLIYFNPDLQYRSHELFYQSLCRGGFLCLGSKETIRFSPVEKKYTEIALNSKIYKKKY